MHTGQENTFYTANQPLLHVEPLELTIHNGQTRLHRLLEDKDAPYNVSVDAVKAIVQQHYLLEMIMIQRYDYTPCHVRKPSG